jgi:xanthine dehydrogenase accessory factor
MRHVLDDLISVLQRGESAVLGVIAKSSGSAPRTSGARMLVQASGKLTGTVGGGAVEGACYARAKELLESTGPETFAELSFELSATSAAEAGMVCGGEVSILLQKVEPESLEQFQQLRHAYSKGLRPVLLTRLPQDGRPPRCLTAGVDVEDDLSAEVTAKLASKKSRTPHLLHHKGQDYFVEPIAHPGTVHLVGAGHVAFATAHLAAFTGFEVVVLDDRVEFANAERYPQAREIRVLNTFDNCINGLGPDDYVVIVTRGHLHDRDVLAQALRTEAGYIGMIGSSKKRKAVYSSLLDEGFSQQDIERVYSPIGISIGADTPEEIGISIVAELVKVRAGVSA